MVKELQLTRGYVALVSDEDWDRCQGRSWCVLVCEERTYAVGTVNGKFTYLHRYLLNAPANRHVDHRDGDGLNCQRENIRLATPRENSHNSRRARNNTSGFKGVSFEPPRNRFAAYISLDGRKRHLGYFVSAEDAARSYDSAARDLFGAFARVNFPTDGEVGA